MGCSDEVYPIVSLVGYRMSMGQVCRPLNENIGSLESRSIDDEYTGIHVFPFPNSQRAAWALGKGYIR